MSKVYKALNRARREGGDPPGGGTRPPGDVDPRSLSATLREVWNNYETLHSSIDKAIGGVLGHALLFASSVESEGASTVVAEYASTFGGCVTQGTLLVDANLRSPILHEIFQIPNEAGFADVLVDNTSLKSAVRPIGDSALYLLPAGIPKASPNALITVSRISRFLTEAKGTYGSILIDGPPLIPYAEAILLASAVDGVILIVESERTKREVVSRAKSAMTSARANILGVVLNRRRYVIPEFLYRQL